MSTQNSNKGKVQKYVYSSRKKQLKMIKTNKYLRNSLRRLIFTS